MDLVDVTVAEGEIALTRGNLRKALAKFLDAVTLALPLLSRTEFVTIEGRERHRNKVKKPPENAARLFGLARLCLTEAEAIVNDEIEPEVLEEGDEDAESEEDVRGDEGVDTLATSDNVSVGVSSIAMNGGSQQSSSLTRQDVRAIIFFLGAFTSIV
jgi:hypothetical protein